ncbi:nicotinamide mononucleotide adenylyltransferase NadR [Psychroflexus gondwanensis ACAM 44]|uniref:Nicotinamide mononucleotide adenylyltransferase NadR n=1 Tax=Psychroflexus gondwanensis ACAM 44 TaxID=1189619 RepID=N1WPY0_9FLAO|nr:ATP-binding protein [Psychroflexus gondwanensis]EMY81010.1 nicotinamide mononucleotide adenylyltransferase NadR [Psychroflexus gondwanensis ACAM 44]
MEKELRQTQDQLTKIVLYGPESTGKTSLARALALEYNTEWVPEFARDYLQDKYNTSAEICEPEDLIPIAKGQLQSENFKSQNAKQYVFCDTNVLQTLVYAKAYFENFQNKILEQCAEECHYAHYFLTYIDTPWVEDDLRDKPTQRKSMFTIFEQELIQRNLPYTILKGDLKQRLHQSTSIIKTL